MKLKKLIRFILIIIILILLFTIIRSTYSKYVTAFEKSTGAVLNAWNIKVNDEKITTNANFTNTLRVNFDTNPHIAANTLAPTRTGTVPLTLDSTGTQVPYEYKIEIVDGNVDYESSADNIFINSWTSNNNKVYEMKIEIDYSALDEPIWYQVNYSREPWWEEKFTPKTIEFTLPEGFSILNNDIYEVSQNNIEIDGTHVTVTPTQWEWPASTNGSYVDPNDPTKTYTHYASNKITLTFQTVYNNGNTDISVDQIATNIALDGKKIFKSNIPDYRIYAYSLNGGEKVILDDTITEISGIVQPAADINTVVKNEILLYVEWYDGPDNKMDNAEDVKVTQSDDPYGTVPIGVFVTQVYQ